MKSADGMIVSNQSWIGVDPGGRDGFGVAIIEQGGFAKTWLVSFADEAIEIIRHNLKSRPSGAGIDAPLWWSSGVSSDRIADQWIRNTYGLSGGNVQTANSLRGAALVQGAMFAYRLREHYPAVPITESHPKAVWVALNTGTWESFCARFGIKSSIVGSQEHERDAIIAAVCAREGFEGRWTNDLGQRRGPSELDPMKYWLAPIRYFWPESQAQVIC